VTTPAPQLGGEVQVLADPAAVARAALEEVRAAEAACPDWFDVALTGGESPKPLYGLLAAHATRDSFNWGAWRVWFGDERAVPPEDPASNYRLARDALLDQVPIALEAIHRMRGELDPDVAAAEYAAELEASLPRGPFGAPRLALVLLGLGENGHCASLFPGTPALEVRDRWATRGRADYAPFDRVTLTYPVLNAAAIVLFLVTGESKGQALRGVAAGTAPAAGVRPAEGRLVWLLDEPAAAAAKHS
jgi:6-phosphogluconolactonase